MKQVNESGIINLKKSLEIALDSIVSRAIIQSDAGNVTLFALDEGQLISKHTSPYDALVIGIEGIGEITIGKQEYHLSEGEAIIMPANIEHAVSSVGEFTMLLIMIKSKGNRPAE